LQNLTLPINPTALSQGVHRLYVRARNANGNWSLVNTWLFYKPYDQSGVPPLPPAPTNITRIEYFVDTDPGLGNATTISFTPGTQLADLVIPINPTLLTEGVHRLHVRARNANAQWSLVNSWLFYRPYSLASVPPPAPTSIKRLEYYIDSDPGLGSAIPLAYTPSTNMSDLVASVNVTGLSVGSHKLFVRSQALNGSWSLVNEWTFSIASGLAAPGITVTSVSRTTLCASDSIYVGYHATGTYNSGNIFRAYLSDATGSFASETEIGLVSTSANGIITCQLPSHVPNGTGYKLRVKSSNTVVTGVVSTASLTIYDRPNIGPDTTIYHSCPGQTTNLIPLYTTTGLTAVWNTGNPTAVTPGIYRLVVTNANGCTDTAYATVVLQTATWTGTVSADWHTPGNWSTGKVPTDKTHVIVLAGTPNICTVSNANGICSSIQLRTGATLRNQNGKTVELKGNCASLPPN
jgi:hypothetical protein